MKEKRKKSFGKKGIPFFQVKDGQPVRFKALVKGKEKNVYGIKKGNRIVCGYKMLNGRENKNIGQRTHINEDRCCVRY